MNKNMSGKQQSLTNASGAQSAAKRGRPKTSTKVITKSTQKGTKEGEERATFIIQEQLIEKIKTIAYWDRQLLKETINVALENYVESWIKKNGELKDRPPEVKARDTKRSNSGRPSLTSKK